MGEHRCRSCLWFSDPLWPEHRPACSWRPIDAKEPPWVRGRHYVTADEAATCRAWEDGVSPEHVPPQAQSEKSSIQGGSNVPQE